MRVLRELDYKRTLWGFLTRVPLAFKLRSSFSGLPGLTSSPRRAAFIAAMVSALGFRGSNGRDFSATTRTSSRRKASDTVSPIFFRAAAASFFVRGSMRARTTELSGTALNFRLSYTAAQALQSPSRL